MPDSSGPISHTWILAVVLALTALAYSPGLSGPFIYDDQDHIEINPKIHSPDSVSDVIFNGKRHRRILLNLSYGLNGWMSGLNPYSYKIFNLVLHLLTVAFLYLYLRRIFLSGLMLWTPLVIFAIHPLQVESVAYIFGRVSLMTGLFTIISLWLLEKSERYPFWKLAGVFVAALLVKESAVLLLFLWPLYFALKKHGSLSFLTSRQALASYSLSLLYLPLHLFVTGSSSFWDRVVGFQLYPMADYLINQLHYYFYTLILFFAPGWQTIYHPFQEVSPTLVVGAGGGTDWHCFQSLVGLDTKMVPAAGQFFYCFLLCQPDHHQWPFADDQPLCGIQIVHAHAATGSVVQRPVRESPAKNESRPMAATGRPDCVLSVVFCFQYPGLKHLGTGVPAL